MKNLNNLDHITNLKQLLKVMLDDVKLVKKDDRYDFDTGQWHKPNTSKGCAVCLAGSIMAKTLGVNVGIDAIPLDFDKRTEVLLRLIDSIRRRYGMIELLKINDIKFDLNNLASLNLSNYDLEDGNIDEWEKLYSDLKYRK